MTIRKTPCQKLLVLDIYGTPFEFILPDNEKKFKTLPGFIATVFTIGALLAYSAYRISLLLDRSNYQILTEVLDYTFDENLVLESAKDKFHIAAGIVNYSSDIIKEDPRIGEVQL